MARPPHILPPHILIVDDHREIRDALVKCLEKNGMRATSTADAQASLRRSNRAQVSGEFRLLTVFLERPRFVQSRRQLLDLTSVRAAQVFGRTSDNQISRLRRKIDADPSKPALIATAWGACYSLASDVRKLP